MSVRPPSWMQRRRALYDSSPIKAHVQSLSTALDVQPAENIFSRRKLQVCPHSRHHACTTPCLSCLDCCSNLSAGRLSLQAKFTLHHHGCCKWLPDVIGSQGHLVAIDRRIAC